MLIKFKDIINPDDQVFNRDLKGKYAFLIQGTYIVPLSDNQTRMKLEKSFDIDKRYKGSLYWSVESLVPYIDEAGTESANDLERFKLENSKSPDGDLTLEQLKHTRTNIAILMSWDKKNEDVWNYYKNGMYSEVVRQLLKYNRPTETVAISGCGCATITPKTIIPSCDPIELYRNGIRQAMYDIVGDLEYWKTCPEVVIREICSYLKNLIKTGMVPSLKPSYKLIFKDACASKGDDSYFKILEMALESFRLILENSDRRNYIVQGLQGFARIYELLEF